jgi:hypothetical protein
MGFVLRTLVWVWVIVMIIIATTGQSWESIMASANRTWQQLMNNGIRGTAEAIWCGKNGCERPPPPQPTKKPAP